MNILHISSRSHIRIIVIQYNSLWKTEACLVICAVLMVPPLRPNCTVFEVVMFTISQLLWFINGPYILFVYQEICCVIISVFSFAIIDFFWKAKNMLISQRIRMVNRRIKKTDEKKTFNWKPIAKNLGWTPHNFLFQFLPPSFSKTFIFSHFYNNKGESSHWGKCASSARYQQGL